MTIRFGFIPQQHRRNGDFVAVDTDTHAAERCSIGSQYWRDAHGDPAATAAEMIHDSLALRNTLPDMPSHEPAAWEANFAELSQLI